MNKTEVTKQRLFDQIINDVKNVLDEEMFELKEESIKRKIDAFIGKCKDGIAQRKIKIKNEFKKLDEMDLNVMTDYDEEILIYERKILYVQNYLKRLFD